MAVIVALSISASLPRTPGAAIVSAVSWVPVKVSLAATGGSLTAVTVIATVATLESRLPSLAL